MGNEFECARIDRSVIEPFVELGLRLDLLELLEGAVEVQWIKPIRRHAVGEQGKDQGAGRIADAQAAPAGKFLHVPEVGPALGSSIGKLVTAIAKVGSLNVGCNAMTI